MTGAATFPFWGSPVISVSTTRAKLFLPQRHEQFAPFGPPFTTLGGEYRLYETPHGVMATQHSSSNAGGGEIVLRTDSSRERVLLIPQGAKPRNVQHGSEEVDDETMLARIVLAWSQFFDDLIEEAKKIGRENKLPWTEVLETVLRVSREVAEPRMALIVDIAERMHTRLPTVVNAVRKILIRERQMLPAGRLTETDTVCLRWYVRQSGESMAQKAAINRQRLLGVARRESFDTLENRVLRDFLSRCGHEGRRYLDMEVGEDQQLQQSKRAGMVRKYRNLCSELHQAPHLRSVAMPPSIPRPNYVLQNDYRYKEIWHHYLRLLRREDEEDSLWDWQARTWADVARFLVNLALLGFAERNIDEFTARLYSEELLGSVIHLLREQHLGSRIEAGCEPGPFVVSRLGAERKKTSIIEVVHPDLAIEHNATRLLGRMGGHLYLVLTPVAGGRRSVVVIWAVHTAGTLKRPAWQDIGRSAGRALQNHGRILDELRDSDLPVLRGFVIASDMDSKSAELHPGKDEGLHLVQVATDQRCWNDALAGINAVIEDILETLL